MPSRSTILACLTRASLLQIAQGAGLPLTGRTKDDLVKTIASARRLSLNDILDRLTRDDLKAVCRQLELDDSGREKALLIDRILNPAAGTPKDAPAGKPDPASSHPAGEPSTRSTLPGATRTRMAKKPIEQYDHKDKKRINNPPVGLVTKDTEPSPEAGARKVYRYDEHLDPALAFDSQAVRDHLAAAIEEGLAPLSHSPASALNQPRATHTLAESSLADQLTAAKAELDRTQAALTRARGALEKLRDAQVPYLNWTGKAERTSFEVPTASLHVHERIDPRTIIEAVTRPRSEEQQQPSLFELPGENPPLRDAINFYKHEHNWTNRMIAGDSLLVMNSLLEKEGMAGKVQMVYMDPPYGIRYGSNFQPFVNKKAVQDAHDDDLTQEPETLKAFRDTWELGIHSYLTYLRDRLLLAKELLHESGSCFVQISDENLHLVRNLMDDVFGATNFIVVFPVKKKGNQKSGLIDPVNDYVVWYAKSSRESGKIKFRKLYQRRELDDETLRRFNRVVLPDGREFDIQSVPSPSDGEMLIDYRRTPQQLARDWPGVRLAYCGEQFTSGGTRPNQSDPIEFKGVTYRLKPNLCWKTTTRSEDGAPTGVDRLRWADRLVGGHDHLNYKRFFDDFGYTRMSNWWDALGGASDAVYVVQTNPEIIKRCVLMTTDPGDLVFDPTCGSGTTAFVAEQWGRRWITTDTSRVAITLARQRLMTAWFDYYKLAHPDQGVGSGFIYKTVPHVMLNSIANNPEIKEGMTREQIDRAIARYADTETLYDQPEKDRDKARVTGPFTVEAVPAPVVRPIGEIEDVSGGPAADQSVTRSGVTVRDRDWRDELLKTGVRGRSGQRIAFTRVEPLAGTRWLHADAETKEDQPKRVVVSFGQDHAPLEQKQVELAWEEARTLNPRPAMILFAAFQFDPEAAKDIDDLTPEKTGITFLKVQMNTDLLTADLKKKRASNESFWLIGQPDIEVRRIATPGKGDAKVKYQVRVNGFDYYNPKTGSIESGDTGKIALWMLDTDYDGRSLYPRQVFLPMAGEKEGWSKLARDLKAEIDGELIQAYRGTESLPFAAGGNKRAAVKIVDDRGIESLKIVELA